VRSDVVVLPPPAFGKHLDLLERVEDLAVEKLVSQSGIERLDVAVLPGTARLDEERSHGSGEEVAATPVQMPKVEAPSQAPVARAKKKGKEGC